MEKYINIVLPDKTIDALEFRHNFTISRVGYYEEPRHHYIERADLGDAILLLCIGGSGYVEYKGRKYDIHRGDTALLEPHVPHKSGARVHDPWAVLWVHFRGEGLPGLLSLYKESGVPPVFHMENYQPAADQINRIILLLRSHYNSLAVHRACCILQMLLLDFPDTCSHRSPEDSRYMEKALRYMKENLYANLDLQSVSRHLGISSFHTIRIFKSAFMTTPMQYYNALRLDEAGRQLLHTDGTVEEISRRMGYSSQFYFSQQFKKKTGLSPTAYRKMMRSKF